MIKCSNCRVYLRVMASTATPSECCPWYVKNVPSGKKSLDECDVCEPVKPDDCEVGNTFESEEDYEDDGDCP